MQYISLFKSEGGKLRKPSENNQIFILILKQEKENEKPFVLRKTKLIKAHTNQVFQFALFLKVYLGLMKKKDADVVQTSRKD